MPFRTTTRGPLLYVSWRGLSPEDLTAVTSAIADLRTAVGRGVVYLARIPFDNRMLTSEEHAMLQQFLSRILPTCATVHHVVEGDGFVKSARRAIVTNLALGTTRPRDFYTHSTLAEAASTIATLHQIDLDDLVTRAAARASEAPRASSAFREAARLAVGRPRR